MNKFLEKISHCSDAGVRVTSVLATATRGRIYAQARSIVEVIELARSIAALDPAKVSLVPPEDVFAILNFSSSNRQSSWPWARVRAKQKKWRHYVGDTGLITTIEGHNKKHLALIPRLGYDKNDAIRAPQALVSCRALESAKTGSYGRFTWKGQMFSPEGLLLIDLDKIAIIPLSAPLPSINELALFQSTSLLSAITSRMTEEKIAQSRMKMGDRVKVIAGTHINLVGEIRAIKEKEVAVYFRSQGITVDIPQEYLRTEFEIGDQVRVLHGRHQGLVGWVTEISTELHISNTEAQIEVGGSRRIACEPQITIRSQVNVARSHVEFYSQELGIGLRPLVRHPKWLGEQNPNDVFNSKRVRVIGHHEWKGYKGIIKSTTPDGYAFVQLDTHLQKSLKVELTHLACL